PTPVRAPPLCCTLSLHDALPIFPRRQLQADGLQAAGLVRRLGGKDAPGLLHGVDGGAPAAARLFKREFQLPDAQVRGELDHEEGLAHVGFADHHAPLQRAPGTSSMSASVIKTRSSRVTWARRTKRTAWRRMARSMMFRTMRALPRLGSCARTFCS